jgi:hypothetical protein
MLGLVLLAHSAADRVVISKTPDLVEVVFRGHYPARLAKDPRLEQALNAAAYKHRQLEREDAGGEVSDVFDAMDGAQHFRIQYEPRRSGWTLGAVVGGRFEPLLHTRSSQRHSPVATQWFVPADGGGNAAEVATLGDVRCEYVSDAAKHAADELQRAADEADAADGTNVDLAIVFAADAARFRNCLAWNQHNKFRSLSLIRLRIARGRIESEIQI